MTSNRQDRRSFVKQSTALGIGLSLPFSAKSYNRIIGANERMHFAVAGMKGRGNALVQAITKSTNAEVTYLCDVDHRTYERSMTALAKLGLPKPKTEKDMRKILEDTNVDAIGIATPDHWHAPMAIMAAAAGKHVYLEKPCSHNPAEGEVLLQAIEKYKTVIQMGNQQRSATTSIQAIKDIQEGIIGRTYYAKAWYSNQRGSIGKGKPSDVPEWLDWELWQGPAPRKEFMDNYVHYNWHWFWHWGTGESCNNGTHEIDICRWALGVDYPNKVTSNGGRYHWQDDDWEFWDTQLCSFEFDGDKMINWEGRSCNPNQLYEKGRGSIIYGTEGTIILDRGGYEAFDNDGNLIKYMKEVGRSATLDTVGAGDLDTLHMQNFLNAVRDGEALHSPIREGHKSVLLCSPCQYCARIRNHLGN